MLKIRSFFKKTNLWYQWLNLRQFYSFLTLPFLHPLGKDDSAFLCLFFRQKWTFQNSVKFSKAEWNQSWVSFTIYSKKHSIFLLWKVVCAFWAFNPKLKSLLKDLPIISRFIFNPKSWTIWQCHFMTVAFLDDL